MLGALKLPMTPQVGGFGCSSFLGLPYRILTINHKKELLRGLWVPRPPLMAGESRLQLELPSALAEECRAQQPAGASSGDASPWGLRSGPLNPKPPTLNRAPDEIPLRGKGLCPPTLNPKPFPFWNPESPLSLVWTPLLTLVAVSLTALRRVRV